LISLFFPLLNGVRVSCAPSLATKDVVSEDPFLKNSLFPPLSLFTKKKQAKWLYCVQFFDKNSFEIHFLRAKDPRSCSHFLPKARLVVKTKTSP
jgi:hypothetical protein